MKSSRASKPELERYEPIRSFNGIFGPRPPANGGRQERSANPSTPITEGVNMGYRVIEEYMRQGQSFAKTMWPAAGSAALPSADPQKMMERMFQYASDLATTWLEYTQATAGQMGQMPFFVPPGSSTTPPVGGRPAANEPARSPATPRHAQPAAPRHAATSSALAPTVSIDIASKARTEVTVDVKQGLSAAVSSHALRDKDSRLPPISDVKVEVNLAENRIVVHIRVADDQPPGTYSGLLIDEGTNLPRGTLAVRVFPPEGPNAQ